MKNIFEKDLSGEMVSPDEPGYEALISDIFATIETATKMNTGYRTPEEVHEYMGRILGKPLEESTTVLPPLYIDYGKHVTIGRGCFIQQCCTFFGRGGITIGDEKVVLLEKVTDVLSACPFLVLMSTTPLAASEP